MRRLAIAVVLFLASPPTYAEIFAYNDPSDPGNKVNITVKNEWVSGLLVREVAQIITIPPRAPEQFHVIRLCTDGVVGTQPWIASAPRFEMAPWPMFPPWTLATPTNCKNVSAWGTWLTGAPNVRTDLSRTVQVNNQFNNNADYDFDDCSVPPGCAGNATWVYRASHGCWPPGLQSKAYFRGEARRTDGPGLAQISVAGGSLQEGTQNSQEAFRSQAKAYTEKDQPEASADHLQIPIPPGPWENLFAVFINPGHKATVHCSGWEMRAQ